MPRAKLNTTTCTSSQVVQSSSACPRDESGKRGRGGRSPGGAGGGRPAGGGGGEGRGWWLPQAAGPAGPAPEAVVADDQVQDAVRLAAADVRPLVGGRQVDDHCPGQRDDHEHAA